MNKKTKLIAASAVLLMGGTATAGTVCVHPSKASCAPTIALGIGAATSGDTISIADGVYYEEGVTIDKAVKLKGSAKVILDGGKIVDPADAVAPFSLIHGTTHGLIVAASGVTVQGISIRNTDEDGIHINDGFTGLTVNNVHFNNIGNNCLASNLVTSDPATGSKNNGLVVTGSQLKACGNDAVYVDGDGISVKNNKMYHMDDGGVIIYGSTALVDKNVIDITVDDDSVYINGNGATVSRNTILNSDDYGIDIDGNSATVSKNTIENVYSAAVYVSGNDAKVEKNKIKGVTSDDAIDVSGQNPVITSNNVALTYDAGIDVSCNTNCAGGLVSKNTLKNIGSDEASGIDSYADNAGLLIEKNKIDLTNEEGIDVSGAGVTTVDKNKVTTAAGEEDCIYASGAAHVISNNNLNSCYESGVYAGGDAMEVSHNTIKGANQNGVEVNANGVTVSGNNIQQSTGFGVVVRLAHTGNFITENLIKNNRDQICDAGVGTVIGGNTGNGSVWDVGTTFGTEGVDDCNFL